ncbi:hypothetical protein EV191_101972 [Tamaricihabitans halophyticus]|uniref:4-amino-4-deoxy-L-arabinose transferase-like glycosyltransferase n=2 Tax=Tamaricihabitans halophyticus TaxID=1262583 RepID=A0A4R2R2N8_9PSEU|nr:hypothetical protein EV191_101972 [Tamaricihabitans halophyticus]
MEPEQTTSEDPPAARSGWSAQSSTLGLVAVAGVFAALVFLLVKDSLTDDAYITLAYAKNLATDGHWGLIPQQISNSATSPLNVLLLGALAWVTTWFGEVSPVFGLGVLTVLVTMAQAWGWARLVRALRLTGWVGIATAAVGLLLVLANPFVLSAVGLEVLLVPAVLVLMVAFVLESRPVAFGVVAGLALLIRLDLVIFVVLLALCTQAIRRKLHIAALSAVLVSAPWYLFSWFYLGSAVPDTLVIKQSQGGLFGIWTYLTGPIMYFIGKMRDVGFAFLPMVFGVLALLAWLLVRFGVRWTNRPPALGPVLALGLGGLAYYGVYTVMGVGPYHWYYVPPMVALSSALAVLAGWWLARAREQERLRIAAPLGALGLVALLGLGNLANDMRHGVPWESPVIFGNWASAQDYARVGEELGQRLAGATVASPGEIGTLAYFCECSIVDVFSDRGQAIDRVDERIDESNAIGKAVWRFNYLWLDRSVQPRPVDYELVYEEGPGSGPDTWEVNSANKGVGHFRLEPAQPR